MIAQNSAREWSALESKFSDVRQISYTACMLQLTGVAKAGYREGISAGRGFTLQAGFDEGYSITGAPLGRELGYLRGLASSLLVYLTSSTASHTPCITSEDREAAVASAREIVRGLGKLKVQDLAPRDLEAEAHAREHGEEVQVPPELAEKREMESLEDQLAGMGSQIGQQEQPSGRQALDDCKLQLQNLLARLGLQALLS